MDIIYNGMQLEVKNLWYSKKIGEETSDNGNCILYYFRWDFDQLDCKYYFSRHYDGDMKKQR